MSHASPTANISNNSKAKKRVEPQSQRAAEARNRSSTTTWVLSCCMLAIILAICGASTVIPTRAQRVESTSARNRAPAGPFQGPRGTPNPLGNATPDGRFDTLYDKDGRKYSLRDLRVDTQVDTSLPSPDKTLQVLSTCTAGYFQLYFEVNSGLAGTLATDVARRNVVCQVFSDIATFLPPPAGTPLANGTHKVNIWVRNIGQIVSNPQSSGVLGLATAFYAVPTGSTASGIVDNQIWSTINSGTDAYTGLAAPILAQGGQNNSGSGSYYHGMIALNFSNSGINWNTNMTSAASSGLYDLYTIALHEITHALGFASLINFDGNSKFGSSQYYGRYDLFLQSQAGIKLLTNAGGCSLYNFGWNIGLTALSTLSPNSGTCGGVIPFNGGNDNTDCATAIEYFSSNLATHQKVYTYDCFTGSSSLSHFEDACAPTNLGNNSYFVMSNANGAGVTKRFLQEEESRVLCDLGYQVNSSYGSSLVWGSSHTYTGSACSRIGIGGVNDGISSSGVYTYTGVANTAIPLTGILANDYITPGNTIAFECLEDLYFSGTLSATSGNSSTTVNYTPPATAQGATVLRYIPVNTTTGKRGNITYIYVYVTSGSCVPNACNMINNGGFENNVNCGQLNLDKPPLSISCWSVISCNPDLYKRNCLAPNYPDITVPTPLCNPPADTWNNGQNNNNAFVGMGGRGAQPFEGIQTTLNSPINPGNTYLLSFWARVTNNNYLFATVNQPTHIEIGGGTTLMAPICPGGGALPPSFSSLGAVVVPNNNQWNYLTIQVTNSKSYPMSVLGLINASYLNQSAAYIYVLIDDVSLTPVDSAPTLSLPPSLFCGSTIPDLSQYATPANGVFSGPGVSVSAGIYTFNSTTAGLGTHTIVYSGTTGNGCPYTVSANVAVVNSGIDLYMKDTMDPDLPEDFGVEPTVSQLLYISHDIWVRTSQDTILTSPNPGPDTPLLTDSHYANEHQHQNPTYSPYQPMNSYVYVKVRNRGCESSAGTEKLRVYWANASIGLPWPDTNIWNEFDCVPGGSTDPCPLPVIAAGEDYVVEIPWLTPDPASFGGSDHFCLVARIETQSTYPYGMTSPEVSGPWLWQNVAANNNIVWKNLTVFTSAGTGRVIVRNPFARLTPLTLYFTVPPTELKDNLLLHGDIFVDLGEALMKKWRQGGQRPQGFEVVGNTTIQITDPTRAILGGLLFAPGEKQTIEVRMQLKPHDKARVGREFNWDVIQMAPLSEDANPSPIGGERYILVVPNLTMTKTVAPNPAFTGQALTYTVKYTNNGTADAFDVELKDTLPPGLTLGAITASCPVTASSSNTFTVTCAQVPRAPNYGSTVIVTYQALANPATCPVTLENKADLTWTSLPRTQGMTVDATGSTTPKISGAVDGERNGVNHYATTAWAAVKIDCPCTATITGLKFNDLNGNGVRDTGEPGLANWTIQVRDQGGNNRSTSTDAEGKYSFTVPAPGTYTVSEVKQEGWFPTTSTRTTITVGANETADVNFGNIKGRPGEFTLMEGMNEFCIWSGGGSFNSPTPIDNPYSQPFFGSRTQTGDRRDVRFGALGLCYGRILFANDKVAFKYTFNAIPVSVISYSENNFIRDPQTDFFRLEQTRRNVFGAGLSPIGFQLYFRPQSRVKPFVNTSGGFIFFKDQVPRLNGARFNFTYEFGGGVQVFRNSQRAFNFAYKYQRIANGGRALNNPGLDGNVFYFGYSIFKAPKIPEQ